VVKQAPVSIGGSIALPIYFIREWSIEWNKKFEGSV